MQPGPDVADATRPPRESTDPVSDVAAGLDRPDAGRGAGSGAVRGALVGVALATDGRLGLATGPGRAWWTTADPVVVLPALVRELGARLAWWSAGSVRPLVAAGLRVTASWDVAATHRLLHGGHDGDPAVVWAVAAGLPPDSRPRSGQLDLLGGARPHRPAATTRREPWDPVRPDGHLRPGWAELGPPTARAARRLGGAARCRSPTTPDRAALADDRRPGAPHRLVGVGRRAARRGARADRPAAGPRHRDRADRRAGRAAARRRGAAAGRAGPPRRRGARPAPGPAAPRTSTCATRPRCATCSRRIGIDVPDTRSWRLEPLRDDPPAGRRPAAPGARPSGSRRRTATAGWTATSAPDGRLRGAWTGCDGAAGRMTASAGLHNLPAELRPAVAAEPGHVLVRADLGQVEPRVLAAVSGDEAFATGRRRPRPLRPGRRPAGGGPPDRQGRGARGDVRPDVRGGRRGAARVSSGPTRWRWPTCAPPTSAGRRGEDVRTYGGRLVRMWQLAEPADRRRPSPPAAGSPATRSCRAPRPSCSRCGRCRCAPRCPRVREIVLCLHDELLVHAPEADARRGRAHPARACSTATAAALGGRQRRPLRRRRGRRPALVGREGLSRT